MGKVERIKIGKKARIGFDIANAHISRLEKEHSNDQEFGAAVREYLKRRDTLVEAANLFEELHGSDSKT